jgi:uncharacterized integral membrane protein
MQIFLFVALCIAVIAVIFAVQNTAPAVVTFFIWKFNGSLALVLLISLAAGALISFFASLPGNIKSRWSIRQSKKKINELETKLSAKQEDLDVLQQKLAQIQSTQPIDNPNQAEEVNPSGVTETGKN